MLTWREWGIVVACTAGGWIAGWLAGRIERRRHQHRWTEPAEFSLMTIRHCEGFCGAHAIRWKNGPWESCGGGHRCEVGADGAHEFARNREKYDGWVRRQAELRAERARFKEIITSDIDWSGTDEIVQAATDEIKKYEPHEAEAGDQGVNKPGDGT